MSAPVRVTTIRRPAAVADDLIEAYERLLPEYGDGGVFLLESCSGPAVDVRTSAVGFAPVLTLDVRDCQVVVGGVAALAAAVRSRVAAADRLVLSSDEGSSRLREPAALWPLLRLVRDLLAPQYPNAEGLAFFSVFGYDAARYVEQLPRVIADDSPDPDVSLRLHAGLVRRDVRTGVTELLVHESPWWAAPDPDAVLDLLQAPTGPAVPTNPEATTTLAGDDLTLAEYETRARACLEHIAAGDVYQVQLGHEITVRTAASPVEVYRRLRASNPSPYMYLAHVAGRAVVGASPELFLRVEDGTITMRPIAGTARREAGSAARLAADPKERAEHVMLVDLCRNDVGRVSSTITVPVMMQVEHYSTLVHLVSTVQGRLMGDVDPWDVVPATFPAGTMTGAPKVRAMELIEGLERTRRGFYAGALGLLGVDGSVNLALCIRTLVGADGGGYRARASAGIVADSRPDAEWRETLIKMGAAVRAVTGTELMT